MDAQVKLERDEGIAILTLAAAPANVLRRQVVAELRAKLGALLADAGARGLEALVLAAEGRYFSAGADLRELDWRQGQGPGSLADLCGMIEAAPVPVVAALQGPALGAGAELALAAHYRVAGAQARIGFPEIGLGLLPMAGGGQRLARWVGAERALDMLLGGRAVPGEVAAGCGLVDLLTEGPAREVAVAFARRALVEGLGPRPAMAERRVFGPGGSWQEAVARRRAGLTARALAAEGAAIDCVEAAPLLPAAAALTFEAEAAAAAASEPAARALRHVFEAERRAVPAFLSRVEGRLVATVEGRGLAAMLRSGAEDAVAAIVAQGYPQEAVREVALRQGIAAVPGLGALAPEQGETGQSAGEAGLSDAEGRLIWRRFLGAVAGQGAELCDRGLAPDPAVVDALWVHHLGWPARGGGPLWAAQEEGLLGLLRDMERWSGEDPLWQAPVLMRRAALESGGWAAAALAQRAPAGPAGAGSGG